MITLVQSEVTDPSERLKAQAQEFGWIQKIYTIYNDQQALFEENVRNKLSGDLES
jgi:hypothetical protein